MNLTAELMKTKAGMEYLALPLKERLKFRAYGRPGATAIKADQKRLRERILDYKRKVAAAALRGEGWAWWYGCGYHDRSTTTRDEWKRWSHEARYARFEARLKMERAVAEDAAEGSPRALFGLPMGHPLPEDLIRLGDGWFAAKEEDREMTWDAYSKKWHRRYGPKVTVTGRRVVFRRRLANGSTEERRVDLPSWRGDWLAAAVVKAGLAPTEYHAPMYVRLHEAYDATLVETKRGYRIYRRTLCGAEYDWVIVSPMGLTYHDKDRKNLIKGLRNKMKKAVCKLPGTRRITWSTVKKLGFCDAGIRAFCDAFGLDPKGAYSPEEIERAVRSDPKAAATYLAELRILSKAISYRVAEFA